jgi:5-methyltetrahydropteroyltriglutamate--homocysteine methyltransferase
MHVEYKQIADNGLLVQLDDARAAVTYDRMVPPASFQDYRKRVRLYQDVLNRATEGIPTEKLRYHVCWGNYRGPHHKDVPLREIADLVLRTKATFIYVEGANPRHEHEWELWKELRLPDDKALIVGVIDPKTNHVEHPELVAQRIQRYASIVGRERVLAAPDCGFATFVGAHPCPPSIAWLKLRALVEGAQLASERLWPRR